MFKIIRQRIRDARTLKVLCVGAERIANEQGQREPGAEHFVLAALDLEDDTARVALRELGVTREAFAAAIESQYRRALASVGLDVDAESDVAATDLRVPTAQGPYRTQASAQRLMQALTRDIMKTEQRRDAIAPLLGAHVLLAAGPRRRRLRTQLRYPGSHECARRGGGKGRDRGAPSSPGQRPEKPATPDANARPAPYSTTSPAAAVAVRAHDRRRCRMTPLRRVLFLSQPRAEALRPPRAAALISITDVGAPAARPRAGWQAMLRVGFDDVDPEDRLFQEFMLEDEDDYVPMSPAQAAHIARFVRDIASSCSCLVVHCRYGQSRLGSGGEGGLRPLRPALSTRLRAAQSLRLSRRAARPS